MSADITKNVNLITVTLSDNDTLISGENINRREVYITAVGGDAWIKFSNTSNDIREGMLIKESAPFPFGLMPDMIYYGKIYGINATQGQAPTVYITELERE